MLIIDGLIWIVDMILRMNVGEKVGEKFWNEEELVWICIMGNVSLVGGVGLIIVVW